MPSFGSLFSGIEGMGVGLERAGMSCAWQVEIDDNCNYILEKHFPNVKRYRDVKEVETLESVDLVCGGFPCQDVSIAGKRKGLAGKRSGLWFEFIRIIESLKPKWVVIENVPGLLSSNEGRDFAVILQGLVKLGYDVCWRILDSQYFGVAQQRRRVFIVGSLGNGRSAEILFESKSMSRNPAEGRKKRYATSPFPREDIARTLRSRSTREGVNPPGRGGEEDWNIVVDLKDGYQQDRIRIDPEVSTTINALGGGMGNKTGLYVFQEKTGALTSRMPGTGYTLSDQIIISNRKGTSTKRDITGTLTGGAHSGGDHSDMDILTSTRGVRRLTPLECERLQGFPDGWTEGLSDTARYRVLGNAVTVNVTEWIGRRIIKVMDQSKGDDDESSRADQEASGARR